MKQPSHYRTNTAITCLIPAITTKTRLRNTLDRFLDGRAGAGGGVGEVDGQGGDGDSHFVAVVVV